MKKLSSICQILGPLLLAAGCSSDQPPAEPGDEGDFEGIEEAAQGLTDLSPKCVWVSGTGVATLTLGTGDVALVNKLSSGALGINGFACPLGATTALLKKLVVREDGMGGAQTVIIDYLGGVFGAGTAVVGLTGGPGIDVDLGAGTDALKFRGTKVVDNFTFGATGIAINTDLFKDVVYANVETFVVTLTDGDDVFSGAGNATVGGAFTFPITVYGGAGNDTLRGGDGDDTLNGGPGNDTFTTGALADGADTMVGGGGVDVADYSTRSAAVKLTNNGMNQSGADVSTVAMPGLGLGSEHDNIATDILTLKGGMGNDTLVGNAGIDIIFGGPGDDNITGGAGANVLNGDAGNDTFDEGATPSIGETINGGAGVDTVTYAGRTNAANPIIVTLDGVAHSGESGENDKVMVDVENVVGGSGNDTITGSAVDNVLDGGPGNDTILGGLGNDTLIGGDGNDILKGEAGDDLFLEGAASNGSDTMIGGAGIDTVDYHLRTNPLTIVMDGPITVGGSPAGTPSGETLLTVSEGDTISLDTENLIGGGAADTITGNALDNTLEGGPGDIVDTISGLGGDDVIDGGLGLDIIDCGPGEDILLDLTFDLTTVPVSCEL